MVIQIVILFGILALIFLVITLIFVILMKKGKLTFKYHRFFAFLTILFAIIHIILVIWRYY